MKNIKKIRGDKKYYRIRVRNYCIGFEERNFIGYFNTKDEKNLTDYIIE